MDPVSIAAALGTLLAPYLRGAAEDFAGEAGQYVWNKARVLWEKLEARFEGDPPAEEVLRDFEAQPDAARSAFEAHLQKKIAEDTTLRAELAEALAEVERRAPHVRIVIKIREAEDSVGLESRRFKRGRIEVTHVGEKAKRVTVAKIDEIG